MHGCLVKVISIDALSTASSFKSWVQTIYKQMNFLLLPPNVNKVSLSYVQKIPIVCSKDEMTSDFQSKKQIVLLGKTIDDTMLTIP